MYPYALIGNCQTSALIHHNGSIDWLCMPRPDSPPIFGKLLDPDGGEFAVIPSTPATYEQSYLPNTNIVVTTVKMEDSAFKITDFCPRFEQFGRIYRPNALFRIVEPLYGTPRIRIKCNPVAGWSKEPAECVRGNSHMRYEIRGDKLRLTTTMSLTHFADGSEFALLEPTYFGLTWSDAIQEDVSQLTQDFFSRTVRYWHTWVKHCDIPSLFQKETIRSALALKLHCYEDTGAILAGLTTSLPEEKGEERNWDYRLCWLRDTYFTLSAFHNLGHFEEMEGFLKFLLGLVAHSVDLKPVYKIDGTLPLPELTHAAWEGYAGSKPVRTNNEAATHIQNDGFGELVLAFAPIYFDERFRHLRTPTHDKLMETLARQCDRSIGIPDAGLWELRSGWQEHSFTNLMCWAGLDRISTIRKNGFLPGLDFDAEAAKAKAEKAVRAAVKDGSLRNGPTDDSFNAALLQLPILRFPDKELNENTVRLTYDALRMSMGKNPVDGDMYLYRYIRKDDFGVPQSAFLFCSFWWAQALARMGHIEEARVALERICRSANPQGLFSEHYHPGDKMQLGNFPQAYSHVGLINAAFAVSPPWSEVL